MNGSSERLMFKGTHLIQNTLQVRKSIMENRIRLHWNFQTLRISVTLLNPKERFVEEKQRRDYAKTLIKDFYQEISLLINLTV